MNEQQQPGNNQVELIAQYEFSCDAAYCNNVLKFGSWEQADKFVQDQYLKQARTLLAKLNQFQQQPDESLLLSDDQILAAWNRSGTTNLYVHQEKGRPIAQAQLAHCQPIIEARTRARVLREIGEWLEIQKRKATRPRYHPYWVRLFPVEIIEALKHGASP
jgi:hypothetical protein